MGDLDFWLGDWTCIDPSDGSVGTNSVRLVLGGNVVEETFRIVDAQGVELNGRSWSVLDATRGWLQTWVDDQGSYLDLSGGPTDEGFVFERPGARMVFRHLSDAGFTWDWEKGSRDEGWVLAWRLLYRRAQG